LEVAVNLKLESVGFGTEKFFLTLIEEGGFNSLRRILLPVWEGSTGFQGVKVNGDS